MDTPTQLDQPGYFDRLVLELRLVEGHPMNPGKETLLVMSGGSSPSEMQIRTQFESLLLGRSYALKVQRSTLHWGGAAESLQLIGEIATDAASLIVLLESLKRLARSLVSRRDEPEEALSEDTAISKAKVLVTIRYPIEYDNLQATTVALDLTNNGAIVDIQHVGTDESFKVEFEVIGRMTVLAKITHRLEPPT